MSKSEAKSCIRGCGATVYFDKDSPTGHPSPETWVPLEIKEGRGADVAHNCPRRNSNGSGSSGGTLDTTTATTTTAAIIATPDSLKLAESLSEILKDYIRLKLAELLVAF
jgi:hypothetical protein